MKTILTGLLIGLLGLNLMSCRQLREYRQIIDAIDIEAVDLNQVADGDYTAECDAILVRARVLVKVRQQRIESIDLIEYKHGRGDAAHVLPERVVQAQSLRVDAISGATNSSKVILEAIELALKQGLIR